MCLRPFYSLLKRLLAADLEARGGIEPPIKVLQTFALPLGDRASGVNLFYQTLTLASPFLRLPAMPGL
jgi:hypothetical protein